MKDYNCYGDSTRNCIGNGSGNDNGYGYCYGYDKMYGNASGKGNDVMLHIIFRLSAESGNVVGEF